MLTTRARILRRSSLQGIIKHLRKVLSRHPPPAPTEAAIRLVEAVGKLQNFVHR